MPEVYTFLLKKSYSRESRTDFPGKREWQNRRDPGKSGTGNPGNETLPPDLLRIMFVCFVIMVLIVSRNISVGGKKSSRRGHMAW
jgi:hypothetical protein